MTTLSVWQAIAPSPTLGALANDISTDVLIVGGGITGVTLALLLARQGRPVVLLEAQTLGSGATGGSTGNLYETLSKGLRGIHSRWGVDVARQVLAQRREAVAFVERESRQAPQVRFRRCPLVQYAMEASYQETIEQEYVALCAAGAAVERTSSLPPGLPPAAKAAVALPGQAQFHPQAWVAHLASEAQRAGAVLHEQTRVLQIDEKARTVTTSGGTVRAQEIVMATHTPKGVRLVHNEMPCHREYGVAFRLAPQAVDPGPAIFWAKGDEGLSIRTVDDGVARYLICVGQEHPVGTHNSKAALMALEQAARRSFGDIAEGEPAFRWSAENFRSADGLPYIGRDSTGCFVATGFATDGLTWGTAAAHLIAEQLAGRESDFARLCRPMRLSPIKGARTILQEVSTTGRALVRDYLTHRQEEKLMTLAPGDSAIVESEGQSCAAWRSPEGELFAVAAVCTHMGCRVHWNSVETSWDCPCHGSRFRPDGTVIEGPALASLERKHLRSLEP